MNQFPQPSVVVGQLLTELFWSQMVLLTKDLGCPTIRYVQHFIAVLYRARLKGDPQVWWIMLLLLLPTSAWLCLQHSRNLGSGDHLLAKLCMSFPPPYFFPLSPFGVGSSHARECWSPANTLRRRRPSYEHSNKTKICLTWWLIEFLLIYLYL